MTSQLLAYSHGLIFKIPTRKPLTLVDISPCAFIVVALLILAVLIIIPYKRRRKPDRPTFHALLAAFLIIVLQLAGVG